MKAICIYSLIFILTASCTNKKSEIAIQPFKNFDSKLVDTLSSVIKDYYDADVIILEPIVLPENAFINVKSPRYRADSLLVFLKEIKPSSSKHIIGLLNEDISTTKKDNKGKMLEPSSKYADWGIMGLGYRPGPSCIVSTYRLKTPNQKLFIERFLKVSLHELGHNFGIPHCETQGCVMQDAAETIATVDKVGFTLCNKCNKIKERKFIIF
jgi:archaemetzincin